MNYSPMMMQYFRVKEQFKDVLLFFRLGDFYEMFFEDADIASRALDLTLTYRNCGDKKRAPMCGVPVHAADTYIARLISQGFKVAICEQVSEAGGKELVSREVVRVVTPGTAYEESILEKGRNNYLCCAYSSEDGMAAAWTDISTGEMSYSAVGATVTLNELLSRILPAEIICNEEMLLKSVDLSTVKYGAVCPFTIFDETAFDYDSALVLVMASGLDTSTVIKNKACVCALGGLFAYINKTQKRTLGHLRATADDPDHMDMDYTARRTLELFTNSTDGKKHGSLLWAIDKTRTAMGARTLRKWLESPLNNEKNINLRLDAVDELCAGKSVSADALGDTLKDIRDIERLCGRLSCGNMLPKDCLALGMSLMLLYDIKRVLAARKGDKGALLNTLGDKISDHRALGQKIIDAIRPDAPNSYKDGGVINTGYNKRLDEILSVKTDAAQLLAAIEKREKELTGIKTLKVGYNRIFGYFIEVSKSNLGQVPYRYTRKQTISTGERFVTEQLKEIEEKVLSAEAGAAGMEASLYLELLEQIKSQTEAITESARAVGYLDCLVSLAAISKENRYVRPVITTGGAIKISEGRHPVVEKLPKIDFTPNSTLLDDGDNKIMLITGPNMAGKSIYMRQVALITVLAHMGCFVPAKSAEICITDKIFTRVGAGDDVTSGRSTFMVEMSEVAGILQNATDRSLILLDEVGRGTATYDGLSIAWAVLETLAQRYKSKVLFSTHYHELTGLENALPCIKNYKMTVREQGHDIVFLRKLLRGSANKSFGIEVAALSGLDENVVSRAKELLNKIESLELGNLAKGTMRDAGQSAPPSTLLRELITILGELDLDTVSPRSALDILHDLKEKAGAAGN